MELHLKKHEVSKYENEIFCYYYHFNASEKCIYELTEYSKCDEYHHGNANYSNAMVVTTPSLKIDEDALKKDATNSSLP